MCFAALVGAYHFDTAPGFWFDEGIIAGAAKAIAVSGVYGTQVAPGEFFTQNFWITTGFPLVFPTAFFLKIFGVSVWAARLAPFLYLLGFVAVSYLLIKKLYGFGAAAWASVLLAIFNPLYGNGKAVLGEVPGLFWLVTGGLLYSHFEEKKKTGFLLAAALSWGVAVSTKPYYYVFIPSVLFLAFWLLLRQKAITSRIFFLLAGIFLLPLALLFSFAFDFSSAAGVGDTISYFLNSYGASSFDPLKNLWRFVSESTPIHFTFLSIFILVAWFARWRKGVGTPPLVYAFFIFMALSFVWYLKTPGWYRYFFSIHLLALILFPAVWFAVVDMLGRWMKKECIIRRIGVGMIASIVFFQGGFSFFHYDDFRQTEILEFSAYARSHIDSEASVLVLSKPEVAFFIENRALYQSIAINPRLSIGKNIIGIVPVDYIIMENGGDAGGADKQDILDTRYTIAYETGHYRLYRLTIPFGSREM